MAYGVQQRTTTQREVLFWQNAHADVQRFTAAGKGENATFEFTVKPMYGSVR